MKKAVAMLIGLVLLVPTFCGAKDGAFKESISRIADIDLSEIRENGDQLSTTIDVKMMNGKEYVIAVDVDKKNITATFTCASGKTIILSPVGIEVIEGEGYQDYDDIENTIHIEPDLSNNCLLNIIAYLILPYPLNLIALYFVFISCF